MYKCKWNLFKIFTKIFLKNALKEYFQIFQIFLVKISDEIRKFCNTTFMK